MHYPTWKRRLKSCVALPVLGAQLLLLTCVIAGLYYAWIAIMDSRAHPAVKTMLVVLLSCGWGLLVEVTYTYALHIHLYGIRP